MSLVPARRPAGGAAIIRVLVAGAVALVALPALAASAAMPSQGSFLAWLVSPAARVIGAVWVFLVAIGMPSCVHSAGLRGTLWVVLALAIAFSAVSWALPFLGFAAV